MAEGMKISADLVVLGAEFEDAQAVVDCMAARAYEKGYVDETYGSAVLKREQDFPTGLEFPLPVAIPHTAEGCLQSFVSVAVPAHPVDFLSMDLTGKVLSVPIVFVFGITNPQDQLAVLRTFARTFGNAEAVQSLIDAQTADVLIERLNGLLGNTLTVE